MAAAILAAGATTFNWLVRTKPSPPEHGSFARLPEVAVVQVEPTDDATPVIGYGTVRAKHQVKIVPQVSGELVFVHEDLAVGKVIPEGDLLFEIDPTVYEARMRQAEGEVQRLDAALARTDQEMANLDERIANAEVILGIDKNDYETSKKLYEVDQVGTRRDLDLVYEKFLREKDALIELRSRRAVIPYVRRETEAELEAARARLKQARHDLENTKIRCPFDARVELVSAYRSQVVTAHFSIATLTDMSAFELPVGVDPRELRWLHETIRPEALREAPDSGSSSGPEVIVRWSLAARSLGSSPLSGPGEFAWHGRVTRFERVDEATRTARLVVEVRNVDMVATLSEPPVAAARPAHTAAGHPDASPDPANSGARLAIGMHCRAELPAVPLTDALLVPRHAVYDPEASRGWVYVFEPQGPDERVGRLARRAVPMLRSVGDRVLVDYEGRRAEEHCELQPGDRVVVSPLIKPVEGMKIRLREDSRVAGGPLGGLSLAIAKFESRLTAASLSPQPSDSSPVPPTN